MSGLILQPDRWAPSATPYAFDRQTYRRDGNGFLRVDAIWAGRKNGQTVITAGVLRLGLDRDGEVPSFDQSVAAVDMRYGGEWWLRWDGHTLLSAEPIVPSDAEPMAAYLGAVLRDLPTVPEEHEGWYYQRKEAGR